jgi:uncharacterized protein (TIGR02271 family)
MADYGTVVGYFPSQVQAEAAVNALKQAGFQQNQIGVVAQSSQAGFATSKVQQTGTSQAYKAGQSAGGAWESVKNFFSGNTAEPYAGESSKETFNDRVVTPEDYGSDDVNHSLAGLSVPAEHARYFGHQLGTSDEGAIVTVTTPQGRGEEAKDILEENGADIGDDAADFDYGAATTKPTSAQNIQLFGEVLRVHKDRVSRGEVRIRKEVSTTTQSIEVPVTREELVVERVPVSGQQAASNATFASEEIRIPLSEERASVEKQAVVREEVRVGKKEVTNVESFDEQVRSEELKVDQDGKSTVVKRA